MLSLWVASDTVTRTGSRWAVDSWIKNKTFVHLIFAWLLLTPSWTYWNLSWDLGRLQRNVSSLCPLLVQYINKSFSNTHLKVKWKDAFFISENFSVISCSEILTSYVVTQPTCSHYVGGAEIIRHVSSRGRFQTLHIKLFHNLCSTNCFNQLLVS